MGPEKIAAFEFTERFKREYRRAKPDVQKAVDKVFKDLQGNPNSRRCHSLTGYKPTIFSADVFSNHSWQLTFEMKGETAVMRRLASHSEIDDSP